MTAPPPPPPPGYAPPPPGAHPPPPDGYPPPPPGPAWVLPKEAYTPWRTRLLAFLIDWTPVWLVFVVPMLGVLIVDGADCYDNIYGSGNGYCSTAQANSWLLVQVIGFLPAAVYFFWNFGYRQGKTGSSIGKSVLKFKVVSERTWQPIGFWPSIGRQIAHYIDQLICYIGYLWPLWDGKRQTIADKIMATVCVPLTAPPPPLERQPRRY